MAENNQRFNIEELADKWAHGKLTPDEQAYLERWYTDFNDGHINLTDSRHDNAEALRNAMLGRINSQIQQNDKPVRNLWNWPRIAAAASIILALSCGGYWVLHKELPSQHVALLKPGTFKSDALPGNKAILTLANGQQMAVTSIPTGHINNTNAQKTANGSLIYNQSDAAPDVYNTLTVPRGGGKHEIRLADGTLAVLDAESSIRFPVVFNGSQRQVEITGQVYFEVAFNAAKPFSVKVNGALIRDLGTHFNINAFSDEPEIKTTLLEGIISVSAAGSPGTTLKPGQQAIIGKSGLKINNGVDLSEVVAWKNDLFKFGKNTSLPTVMNQLSRWYDMDIVYQGASKVYHFGGDMPRYSKLSDVLKILAYSGVQFSVDGKKIIVYQ